MFNRGLYFWMVVVLASGCVMGGAWAADTTTLPGVNGGVGNSASQGTYGSATVNVSWTAGVLTINGSVSGYQALGGGSYHVQEATVVTSANGPYPQSSGTTQIYKRNSGSNGIEGSPTTHTASVPVNTWVVLYGHTTRFLAGTGFDDHYYFVSFQCGVTPNYGGGGEPATKAIHVKYFNSGDAPVEIQLLKNGVAVGSPYTVGPNTLFAQTINGVTAADTYSLVVRIKDYITNEANTWTAAPGAVTTLKTVDVPEDKKVSEGSTPTPTNTVDVPTVPGPAATTNTGGTVWRSGGGSTDALTNAVFREGIDKVTERQDKQIEAEKKAQTEREKMGKLADAANTAKTAADQATASMAGQGASAKSQAEALIGTAPTGKGYALNANGAPSLSVAMPSAFGGGTFQFNPFTSERLLGVCQWFRTAVEWLTIATLAAWVWAQLGQWVRGFSGTQQAKGNTIAMGTGGQATALAAAGLMTVAIIAGLTVLLAWSFDGLNVPALVASVTTNPLATIPAGSFWMLDQVFPVATMVTALVAKTTFNMYASATFAGCAAVVRFIVP